MDYWVCSRNNTITRYPLANIAMSRESFLQEIESRKKQELHALDLRLAGEKAALEAKKENTISEIQRYYGNEARIKSQVEAAKIVEAARLQARKVLFEAINRHLDSALNIIKDDLHRYSSSEEYKATLHRMISYAKKNLGHDIKVICRREDKSILAESEVSVIGTMQTIGGFVAQSKDDNKELDLTFEELLRIHDDEIESLITEVLR